MVAIAKDPLLAKPAWRYYRGLGKYKNRRSDAMIPRAAAFVFAMAICVTCFAKPANQPEKDKEAIRALFYGIPMDLRAKVKDNPVRCDRVNDWLRENIAGKGKTVGMTLAVETLHPVRVQDGTYLIRMAVKRSEINVLAADWNVIFSNHAVGSREYHFYFEGVSTADAEKLADAERVHVQGTVKHVLLSRYPDPLPSMRIVLENVFVDGKKWTMSSPSGPVGFGGKGNPPGGKVNPFGDGDGGKTKKSKGK
jgi:hypothetical protein